MRGGRRIDLRRVEEVEPQRAADAAPALLRRLAAARLAGQGAARAQRQRAFRLDAAARREDRLLRARSTRARELPALFRITPFVQPREPRAALAARGYEAFDTTLVQVTPLDASAGVARRATDIDDRCAGHRRVRRRGGAAAGLDAAAARRVSRAHGEDAAADALRCCAQRGRPRRRRRHGDARGRARRRLLDGHRARACAARGSERACSPRLLRGRGSTARSHAYLQVDARQRARARRVSQVRLRDRVHVPLLRPRRRASDA